MCVRVSVFFFSFYQRARFLIGEANVRQFVTSGSAHPLYSSSQKRQPRLEARVMQRARNLGNNVCGEPTGHRLAFL